MDPTNHCIFSAVEIKEAERLIKAVVIKKNKALKSTSPANPTEISTMPTSGQKSQSKATQSKRSGPKETLKQQLAVILYWDQFLIIIKSN